MTRVINCVRMGKHTALYYLFKAAGLGFMDMAEEILSIIPTLVDSEDNEGKTPLHYSAVLKDQGDMYNMLVEHGADEKRIDYVSKHCRK